MVKALKTFGIIWIIALLAGFYAPQASALDMDMDWLNPVKQLISPTEAAEREAARAEHKARELERRAAAVQAEADEARAEAEAAKDKASEDDVVLKRSTSKAEPVKAVSKSEPVKAEKVAAKEDKSSSSLWNPVNWFGSDENEQTAAAKADGKVYREEAIQMPAIATPVAASTKPAKSKNKKDEFKLASNATATTPDKTNVVVLETEKGNITIELLPAEAPKTVANFKKLVNEGFYDQQGMKFHRVVPGFVVQTGDPTGTGAGGSKDRIPLEVKNKLSHESIGWVGMARGPDPNSATSQFYITLAPQKSLDGKYAIFGKVIYGYEVLQRIEKDNKLYGASFADPEKVAREPIPQEESRTWKKWF